MSSERFIVPPITVHHLFGAGERSRMVVAEQQRLGLERQVAVDDRDPQRFVFAVFGCWRRAALSLERDLCASAADAPRISRRSGRLLRGSTPFSGWWTAAPEHWREIDAVSGLRKEVSVRDRVDRQVAAGSEAADPRRRNERASARSMRQPPSDGTTRSLADAKNRSMPTSSSR